MLVFIFIIKMLQVVDILPYLRFILCSQYHGGWWHGDASSQGFSNHSNNQVIPENFVSSITRESMGKVHQDYGCFTYENIQIIFLPHDIIIKKGFPFDTVP